METTCQFSAPEVEYIDGKAFDTGRRVVCGAPIPRLDEGPCENCGYPPRWHPLTLAGNAGADPTTTTCDTYLGPLASECSRGHPVAVPSEAERRG